MSTVNLILIALLFAKFSYAQNVNDVFLTETSLLDFSNEKISSLIEEKKWKALPTKERINTIYEYVQNEIKFGYNESDDLKASEVLKDGYGQCNTKGTLLMALLRGAGIPTKFHGFGIDKRMQKGVVTGLAFSLAPDEIIHSWVEVWQGEKWVILEGFILDRPYLQKLQQAFSSENFCGYGVATKNFKSPQISWDGNSNTFIQKDAIVRDYGIFNSPDDFYEKHGVNLNGFKSFIFRGIVRHRMNDNVEEIRSSEKTPELPMVCELKDIKALLLPESTGQEPMKP